MSKTASARFGQRALAEAPGSLQSESKFVEAMSLHCNVNGQLGHLCGFHDKFFTARFFKLIIPTRFTTDLFAGILEEIGDQPLPVSSIAAGEDAQEEPQEEPGPVLDY